jgi:AcrR family transcriptional regulator
MIIERAASLFSMKGFAGASMSDIMHETGLEKGGIYNHFQNKDQIALEAFDYSFELLWQHLETGLEGKTNAVDRLLGLVTAFASLLRRPEFAAGCPVLNTAIDSDDTHPELKTRVRKAGERWYELLTSIVAEGKSKGELRTETDAHALATTMIASLEGAVMLVKLYSDRTYMEETVKHLTWYIRMQASVS